MSYIKCVPCVARCLILLEVSDKVCLLQVSPLVKNPTFRSVRVKFYMDIFFTSLFVSGGRQGGIVTINYLLAHQLSM